MPSHNVIVIINVFIVCNKSAFLTQRKKRVRLYMCCCQRSPLRCRLICSFILQALIECLLCPRHSGS